LRGVGQEGRDHQVVGDLAQAPVLARRHARHDVVSCTIRHPAAHKSERHQVPDVAGLRARTASDQPVEHREDPEIVLALEALDFRIPQDQRAGPATDLGNDPALRSNVGNRHHAIAFQET